MRQRRLSCFTSRPIAAAGTWGENYEIILVDDGSSDEIAIDLLANRLEPTRIFGFLAFRATLAIKRPFLPVFGIAPYCRGRDRR